MKVTMTSHDDIYRKIRTNHRKAKQRDAEQVRTFKDLQRQVKKLYVHISVLGTLIVGDIITRYITTK